MPSARAIRYKSGLANASTLRAFRYYPYCFGLTELKVYIDESYLITQFISIKITDL